MQSSQAESLARPRLRGHNLAHFLRDIVETILLITVIYTLVNLATARFVVDGRSMQPTFMGGQFLIVSRVNYMLGSPQRGEIIVFEYPLDPTQDYIKRVIGLPGDTVKFLGTQVYINDVLLDEPYINEPCTFQKCPDMSWTLGEDEYFFMGDNRNHSEDSRVFGPVSRQYIVGEALVRYWPISDWSIIPGYYRQEVP